LVAYVPVLADIEIEAATLDAARAKAADAARQADLSPDDLARSYAPQWHEMDEVEVMHVEPLPPKPLN